jgi:hypothetical protein
MHVAARDTLLHKAVRPQKIDVILGGCADVDVWDIYNSTPLHEVEREGVDIAELLGHGADVSALAFGPAIRSQLDVVKVVLKTNLDVIASVTVIS